MMQVSDNISSLKRILTIKEEIELAYLNPAFTTATSKLIRKMEAETQLHAEIYRKLEEYSMINMIEIEQERKMEDEERNWKTENERKVWIENILHQLELDVKKHEEEILMQLNEKKNVIEEKLKDIPIIIEKIDLYLDLLKKQKTILENENHKLIAELNAIHFDKLVPVILNGKLHNIDLNELRSFMIDNRITSINYDHLIEEYIHKTFGTIKNQDEINKATNQVKNDSNMIKAIKIIDNHNKNLEDILIHIDGENKYAEKCKYFISNKYKNTLLDVKNEMSIDLNNSISTAQFDKYKNSIDAYNVIQNEYEIKIENIMNDISSKIAELEISIKVHQLRELNMSSNTLISDDNSNESKLSNSDEDDEYEKEFNLSAISAKSNNNIDESIDEMKSYKPSTVDDDDEYEKEFSLSDTPTESLSTTTIFKKVPPGKMNIKQDEIDTKKESKDRVLNKPASVQQQKNTKKTDNNENPDKPTLRTKL